MPKSKIQDKAEAIRWHNEGKTYQWMVDEYRRKYNIETTVSMWNNFRIRQGLDRRAVWDDELIPWPVKPEHRYAWDVMMLRREARRRGGLPMKKQYEDELDGWIRTLQSEDAVVHYDPDTEQGWFHVPRRPKIDTDLIRVPDATLKRRRATE